MDSVVKLVEALVWPAVVVFAIYYLVRMFKEPLTKLLDFRFQNLSLNFLGAELNVAAREALEPSPEDAETAVDVATQREADEARQKRREIAQMIERATQGQGLSSRERSTLLLDAQRRMHFMGVGSANLDALVQRYLYQVWYEESVGQHGPGTT
ncbi:hypothetical protein ACFLIM_39060 [Nonomuraea sp. M3C6]|uniref:Uncharacterized protein n=1 Tax=Nonomuraea marmarensis TaxID=3351344 RepID=A0ABW7AT23_9ACTN